MILPSYNIEGTEKLLQYENPVNSVTFFAKTETFPRHISYGPEHVPHPTVNTESDTNRGIYFTAYDFGYIHVDWGDGTEGQYPFQQISNGNYMVGFRSMDVPYWKNDYDNIAFGGYYLADGSPLILDMYHRYTDGVEEHTVTMDFTVDVYNLFSSYMLYGGFPILNIPKLIFLAMGGCDFSGDEIDETKIGYSVNLRSLYIGGLSNNTVTENFPEAFLKLSQLRTYSCNGNHDFRNFEGGNYRRAVALWPNMATINWNGTYAPYVKEMNSWINSSIHMQFGVDDSEHPKFDDVETINPNISHLDILSYGYSSYGVSWKEELIKGKGLQHLKSFEAGRALSTPVDSLPSYFHEMRSLETLSMSSSLRTQERMDTFVGSFYDYVTSWDYITMDATASDGGRNQYYGLAVTAYSSSYPYNVRPSGTLEAPDGFKEGVSNGNPATPLQKVYVLVHNYGQSWTLPPESLGLATLGMLSGAPRFRMYISGGKMMLSESDFVTKGEQFVFKDKWEGMELAVSNGFLLEEFEMAFNKLIGITDEVMPETEGTGGGNSLIHNNLAPLVAFKLFLLSSNLRLREGLCHAVA